MMRSSFPVEVQICVHCTKTARLSIRLSSDIIRYQNIEFIFSPMHFICYRQLHQLQLSIYNEIPVYQ